MSLSLPERPNLTYLKAQAKELLAAYRRSDPAALNRFRPYFDSSITVRLAQSQLVLAREYGYESWTALKNHVLSSGAGKTLTERADQLAALAVQSSGSDIQSAFIQEAELGSITPSAACVTGNVEALRQFLNEDAGLIHSNIGLKKWEPLLYICYSCLLRDASFRPNLVAAAQLLLEAGANPNAAWINTEWENFPESCLYGASGINGCPELTELLLRAGANPNDGESLYHSTELEEVTCLELLMQYGARIDEVNALAHLLDGEKPDWLRIMLSFVKDPVRIPPVLSHALRRGRSSEIFRILIDAGIALDTPDGNGLTPYQSATRLGRTDVTALLETAGTDTTLTDADRLLGRLARGESISSDMISPSVIHQLDHEPFPELIRQAERGNDSVLETLLAAGANPNVRDRQNVALHLPAMQGQVETVRVLLHYGADPMLRDSVHQGDAIGWACHGSKEARGSAAVDYVQIVELLLKAGGALPDVAVGCPEVRELLLKRGSKEG